MSGGFEPQKTYGAIGNSVPDVGFHGLQFSPTELYNLSENITTNINTIIKSWKNLEQALKNTGTDKDNQELRDKIHVTQQSCNQIVSQTAKDLQRLTVVVRKGDKQQKLQAEKLTGDFRDAVQCYSRLQKQVAEKMKTRLLSGQTLGTTSEYDDEEEQRLTEEAERTAAQKSLQRELQFEQEMLLEREQRIRQIEGDVLDVNEIMRELGAMIHEQADTINSIENNIENVHGNVELGQQELQKAADYQIKHRKKMLFLIAVAVIIGIILTVIIVTQLKS
jgi:t-SNARE complex subunit (syntaxin)